MTKKTRRTACAGFRRPSFVHRSTSREHFGDEDQFACDDWCEQQIQHVRPGLFKTPGTLFNCTCCSCSNTFIDDRFHDMTRWSSTAPPSSTEFCSRDTHPRCQMSSLLPLPLQAPIRCPKLTDHLRQVSGHLFPPRQRSIQPHHPTNPISPLALSTRQVEPSKNESSMNSQPPARRSNIFPSYVPLPATPNQKFAYTRDALHHWAQGHPIGLWDRQRARVGTATAVHAFQHSNTRQTIIARPASVPVERSPFHNTQSRTARPSVSARNPPPRSSAMRDTTKSRIHLRGVTGSTNVVESPGTHTSR